MHNVSNVNIILNARLNGELQELQTLWRENEFSQEELKIFLDTNYEKEEKKREMKAMSCITFSIEYQ